MINYIIFLAKIQHCLKNLRCFIRNIKSIEDEIFNAFLYVSFVFKHQAILRRQAALGAFAFLLLINLFNTNKATVQTTSQGN